LTLWHRKERHRIVARRAAKQRDKQAIVYQVVFNNLAALRRRERHSNATHSKAPKSNAESSNAFQVVLIAILLHGKASHRIEEQ